MLHWLTRLSPTLRAALALLLFSAWLALLFAGFAGGGAVHLLLLAALVFFPWKAAAAPPS
jgi:hypothetical protein